MYFSIIFIVCGTLKEGDGVSSHMCYLPSAGSLSERLPQLRGTALQQRAGNSSSCLIRVAGTPPLKPVPDASQIASAVSWD